VRIEEWARRYARAWEEADAEAAGALFSDDATYRSDPFREPHRGRAAIADYWRDVTASQSNVVVRMGRPVVSGSRAVVEWWTEMDNDGTPVTLPGALILDFDETGQCCALREYFNLEVGSRMPPPAGWGA
jgi:hypothetical protein